MYKSSMDLRKTVLKRRVSIGGNTIEMSESGTVSTGVVNYDDGDEDSDREKRENFSNCEKLNPLDNNNNSNSNSNNNGNTIVLKRLEGLDEEYSLFMDEPQCPILKQSNEFQSRSLLDSSTIINTVDQPVNHRRVKSDSSTIVTKQIAPLLSRTSSHNSYKDGSTIASLVSNTTNNSSNSSNSSSNSSNSNNSSTLSSTNSTTLSVMAKAPVLIKKKNKSNFWSLDQHNIFNSDLPNLSEKSRIFVGLFKRVLDEKDQILNRNDRSLKNFILKLVNTVKVMINSGGFVAIIEDIKFITEITVKSGYFIESMRSIIRLLGTLRDTDETLTFFVEFKKMIKIVNSITKAITNESQTYEMFKIEEKQRMKIVQSLKNLINFVLHNEEFIILVKNIENLKKQVSIAKEEQSKIFPIERLKALMKDAPITNDMLLAIQSIIGEKINIRLMSRNIREIINYVKTNSSYAQTIKEFTDLVGKIYSMDELYLNEELEVRARSIIDKLEKIFIEICALPSMVEFRIQTSLVISSFKKDPINSQFIEDLKLLFKSMLKQVGNDKKKYRLDYEMFNELKHMFIPWVIEKIRTIPIPTITNMEDANRKKKIDFKLEDINIKLTFFDPNCFNIGILACIQAAPLTLSGKISSLLMIELSNIKFRIDNMKWYFKKYGLARIKDTGLANVFTGEKGIDVKVKLGISQELFKEKRLFTVDKIKCKINDIHIQILNSKHNKIYEKIFKLFQKKIKSGLEEAITGKMFEKLSETERMLSEVMFTSDDHKETTIFVNRKVEKKVQREKILERIDTEVPRSSKVKKRSVIGSSSSDADDQSIKDLINKEIIQGEGNDYIESVSVLSDNSHPNYSDNLEDLKRLTKKTLHRRRSSLGGRIETRPVTFIDELNPKLEEHLSVYKYEYYGIPNPLLDSECYSSTSIPQKISADPFL